MEIWQGIAHKTKHNNLQSWEGQENHAKITYGFLWVDLLLSKSPKEKWKSSTCQSDCHCYLPRGLLEKKSWNLIDFYRLLFNFVIVLFLTDILIFYTWHTIYIGQCESLDNRYIKSSICYTSPFRVFFVKHFKSLLASLGKTCFATRKGQQTRLAVDRSYY